MAAARPFFSWQQTMLRVKDPIKSVNFYQSHFGMKLISKYDFPDAKFSLYFLATLRDKSWDLEPTSEEAHKFLWNFDGTCLELTHNWGTENDPDFSHNSGNEEPYRGFGHIAFHCEDLEQSCSILEAAGVQFKKKPNEGRMSGLAFVYDPDGYWIEVIPREKTDYDGYNLSQTMLRVKDIEKSLHFYRDLLGMTVVKERHFEEAAFSLYFLASARKNGEDSDTNPKTMYHPILELTHNHGTEKDPNFSYHSGNEDPKGFGHTGFLVDDLQGACDFLEKNDVSFKKKPHEGSMRGLAFAYDPDGYWVEIIQRGLQV